MGYSTTFIGQFKLSRQVTMDEYAKFHALKLSATLSLQKRRDAGVLAGAPDAYLQWSISYDGRALEWDRSEKFYKYDEWLTWLLEHYFQPHGITISGEVAYEGETASDRGVLWVRDGKVGRSEMPSKAAEEKAKSITAVLEGRKLLADDVVPEEVIRLVAQVLDQPPGGAR